MKISKDKKMNSSFPKRQFHLVEIVMLIAAIGCASGVKKTDSQKKNWTESLGVGTIYNGEIGKAKDDALDDAKRNAVKQVIGTVISGRTDIANGEFLSSTLIAKTQGFIETFKILGSKAISQNEYQVKILAKVNRAKIEKSISEVISNMGKPRFMVILEENFIGKKILSTRSNAGVAIESVFSQKGFPMVDKSTVEKILAKNKRKIARLIGGNARAAKELGVDAGAEIILIGTSTVKKSMKIAGTSMFSVQADVNLKAVDVATGKILSAQLGHGAYPHINPQSGGIEALKKAVKKISKPMINEIIKKWDPNRAQTIALLVTGLNYTGVKKFRSELLSLIRGVKAVNRKGSVGRASKLEVEFAGSAFDLTDRITETSLSFNVKVGEVKRTSVNMHLTKK